MAEQFHVPPWIIENEITPAWWEMVNAYNAEMAAFNKRSDRKPLKHRLGERDDNADD